ncbi:hypothetical protein [Trinickia symbiotica]|uniref:hypothetical protein n=1 Tax=Trinickia symbiotica TaxID=863227 RepID=UPI0011AF0CE5|nr:hypothetical protein [Trinickia symbiotica]
MRFYILTAGGYGRKGEEGSLLHNGAFGLFRGKIWKERYGRRGAVPINTVQTVSYERLAPGEAPPPPPPKSTAEQIKAQQAEAAHQKLLAEQAKKQQPKEPLKQQPKEVKLTVTDEQGEVVAKRQYKVFWDGVPGHEPLAIGKNSITYQDDEEQANHTITIPPSFIDRIGARLPLFN